MTDYGPTQEVVDEAYEEEENEEIIKAPDVWGRLLPLAPGFAACDLAKDEYTFGRGEECDHVFVQTNGKVNPQFSTFSKVHFILYLERDKANQHKYTAFVQDKSSNGTFINGEKIGKNNTQVLNNNDEIALSLKKNKVFIFHDNGSELTQLPDEFKQRYTLSKELGKGACGTVKLAFEKKTCNKFAVKIINKKTFSVGPLFNRAALEEVNILKALQHPCIIAIEDVYETRDTLFIVLELVEGGELFERVISLGRFPEATAKLLFYEMLVAVKYLHDQGITHRDLKPENILLASEDRETLVKVTDFGLSKFVGENSLMKTLCGTPSYLAPEVLKTAGTAGYDKAVDCWSLGVILYIMLGGYPPFSDEITEYTLRDQICEGRYSFPDKYWGDVTPGAIDLIKKLLVVNPKQRITTSEALEHVWLQDQDVIKKAVKLMSEASKRNMPPPNTTALLGHKRLLLTNETHATKRPASADHTPPMTPVSPAPSHVEKPQREASIASTITSISGDSSPTRSSPTAAQECT